MNLEQVVPWGRNLKEYKEMFLLNEENITSNILGCGDGPSSFNYELTKQNGNVISIDPIYQFSQKKIRQRIDETSSIIINQLTENKDDFVWRNISCVDELIEIRLNAMNNFLKDYEIGKSENRYIFEELPKLSFNDNSFDLVLCSHFLFLYSEHFNLQFHIDSILEMIRVSKNEVRIFPILNLKNEKSIHLKDVLEVLENKGYKFKIVKTNYEFQKCADEMLRIIK
ncbi:SAM-dependent methyltransferase [Sulfurimonas lithotrophica]|uniref:SAM-dependent methyltransferase n=1 Tax=Sulfurimonas lithotrophica TaxID=2590022 RepID=A0A5P8NZB3_9BACT|nr:SAM-dependent methyltransferase [Sulfurimonas lithotrophica]QFR48766.1 SAM-dependent methyltransferase [Sulfurimonas lithotrophica]